VVGGGLGAIRMMAAGGLLQVAMAIAMISKAAVMINRAMMKESPFIDSHSIYM